MAENIYEFYQVDNDNPTVFSFYSYGVRNIKKVVTFEYGISFSGLDVDNLVLADEREDGSLDAEVDSNNGDILKVLDTTAAVLEHYLTITNGRAVYIKGADERRINVYHWRITRLLDQSKLQIKILGQTHLGGPFKKLEKNEIYVGFLVISKA
ncbi:MAG: hypothetical protein JWQ09_725 [Segetibacter sp.]|nr:hypothetical protein [Segetibacter sp.]